MQLGSILINGAEKITKTMLRDFEIVLDSGDRMGSAKMLVLYDPASDVDIFPGATVDIYSTNTDDATGLWGTEVFGEPLFGDGPANVPVFSGTITNIEREVMVARRLSSSPPLWGTPEFGGPLFGTEAGYERVNLARIECRDWNSILENGIVALGTAGYTSKTDAYIINALFSATAPTVDLTNVSSTATLATFDQVEGQSLRSILQRLSDMTGAVYYIDPTKKLHWFLPASRPADWSISESPDNTTSFGFDRNTFRYVQEWRTPANKVNVLGAVSTGGARISATRSDATSISTYGTFERTISDRTITSTGAAQARGDVELANYANPQRSGRFTTRKGGLGVGQLLTIDCTNSLQFSGNFVIRRITMRWWGRDTTNYDVEWGAYLPDLARALRAIYDQANQGQPTGVQPTTPATNSVTNSSIGDGTISGVKIMDATIDNAKITNLNADKLNAGDVTVGGSGNPGQLVVQDASGSALGYIGGAAEGGWLKALAVGGSGTGTAKFSVDSSGVLTIILAPSDSVTVAAGGGMEVSVNSDGVKAFSGSNYSLLAEDAVSASSAGTIAQLKPDGLYIQTVKVVGGQQGGWSAWSGSALRARVDTGSATITQCAETIKALIDDLKTIGLFS